MRTPVVAVELEQGIQDGVAAVTSFVPELLAFLVTLVGGTLVAKLLARSAGGSLRRVGFDKVVRRSRPGKALSTTTASPSDVVARVAFVVLVLFVLRSAFAVFGSNPFGELLASVLAFLPNVLVAGVIAVLAAALAAAARDIVATATRGTGVGGAAGTAAGGLVLAVGTFAALSQLQVAPRVVEGLYHAILALVVGSGIIAIGVGGIPPMRAQWEKGMRALGQEVQQRPPQEGTRSTRTPSAGTAGRRSSAPTVDVPAPQRDGG